MRSTILESSGSLLARGIIAILFGAIALLVPASAFFGFVLAFGAFALADGIFALIAAIKKSTSEGRGWLVFEGIAGILAGLVTFMWPGITAVALISLVAVWAAVTGVMKILLAIQLRKVITDEWFMALSGVASILLAALIIFAPAAATRGLMWAIGIYAIVVGCLLIGLYMRVRRWERGLAETTTRRAA
jgi:uncharacterized membrane protein HdeD (DUF308 family)